MSNTPRTDEIWGIMHGSGYQMMLLCQKLERELAEIQNAFENAVTAREQAEEELAACRVDAGRYRELRKMNWHDSLMCVVVNPRETVRLGADCPSAERLDTELDAAIKGSAT